MKAGDRKVYVIDGNVVQYTDKSGIDVAKSDKSIVVCDAETGKYEYTSPDQLMNVGEPADPSTLSEAYMANERAKEAAANGEGTAEGNAAAESNAAANGDVSSDGGKAEVVEPAYTDGSRVEINGHEYDVKSEGEKTVVLVDEHGKELAWTRSALDAKLESGDAEVLEPKAEAAPDVATEGLKAGDVFADSDGNALTVKRVDGDKVVAVGADGKEQTYEDGMFEQMVESGVLKRAQKTEEPSLREIKVGDVIRHKSGNEDTIVEIDRNDTRDGQWPKGSVTVRGSDGNTFKDNLEWYEALLNDPRTQPGGEYYKDNEAKVTLTDNQGNPTPQSDLSSESKGAEQSSDVQAEVPQVGVSENAPMPMRVVGKGKNAAQEEDWLATTPKRGHDDVFKESGLDAEEANAFVENKVAEAEKNLEKVKGKAPKMGTNIAAYKEAKADYEARVAEAQKAVDYWHAVKAERDKVLLEERRARKEKDRALYDDAVAQEEQRKAEMAQKAAEQEALGSNAVAPAIKEKWENAPKVDGGADEITLPNGEVVTGHYVLTESGAASASHQATNGFAETEGYPVDVNGETVNDRDYKRDAEAQQVTRGMAADYDSRALQSPVVVSGDGVVLSGNGRTMAGEIAALNGSDAKYNAYLRGHAGKFGFTTEQVEEFEHPRVVFVPDGEMPYTSETFAKFNQREQKSQSRTEMAVKLGKVVDDALFGRVMDVIGRHESLAEFYADDAAAASVVKKLADAGVIPQTEMAQLFDGGRLSESGQAMVEGVLVGKVFQGSPDAVRQITEVKSMRKAVMAALPEVVACHRLGGGYDLSKELAAAVDLVYKARKAGFKLGQHVSQHARQGNLFQLDDGATVADYNNAAVMMLADVMNDGRVTQLKKVLSFYNTQAADSAQGIGDMFAGGVKSKGQIINEVNELLNNGQEYDRRTPSVADGQGVGGEGGEQGDVAGPSHQGGEGSERGLSEAFDGLAAQLKTAEGEERKRVLGEMRDGIARFAEENGYPVPEFLLTREDFLAAVPEKDRAKYVEMLEKGMRMPAYYENKKVYYFVEGCDNFDKDVAETLAHEYTHADNAEFPENVNAIVYAVEDTHEVSQDELVDILEKLSDSTVYEEKAEQLEAEGKNANPMLADEVIAHSVGRMVVEGEQALDGITKNPTLQFFIKRAYKERENERQHNLYSNRNAERADKTVPSSGRNSSDNEAVAGGTPGDGQLGGSSEGDGHLEGTAERGLSAVSDGKEVAAPSLEGAKVGVTDGEKSSATGDVVPSGKGNTPLSEKIATASAEVNTEPTEAQKEAGNYKKGHVQVGTFDITIEQPQGSVRKGTDADGKQWESKMNNTYGYIRGAVGVDGDHIDVFLSNDIDGWNGRKVFVVDQYNPDGSFDEHKVMLGFNDADEAKSDYLANYENGWENGRRIDVTAVNLEDFEKWIASSKRKTKPFGEYSSVKNGAVPSGEGDTPLLDVDGKPIVVKADDGKVELNLRTWQDEKQQVRDALLDGGLEPEAVDAMMAQAETIASGMSGLADKYPLFGAWQKVAATNRPILRNNAGGYLSFDYSFNCVKKDALNAVMEALVAEGKGGHLGVTQVEALKKVLQKHGFLTPCVMCYVEAKRKVYKQSKEMAAKWNAVAEAAGLTGEEMGAERELGAEQRNALAQLANGENLGSVKGYAEKGKYGIKKDTIVKIAKLMLDSAKLRGRMNYEWMMSPSSYTEMYNKFGDTGLMEFMSQGQSRGKALLETSPFSFKSVPKDLMMGIYNPVVLANMGGVRQFSYEDARAVMFFDYYTQFLVMQGARAPEHLYTKRPFMPEMFGRTGAMMNQSLIVDIWRGEEWHKKALGLSDKEYDAWLTAHAGFVPRGALPKGHTLYEAGSTELVPNWGVESFPVDIAMKNVHNKDYKGTVGNVVVAPNRKFILWALDNPDIHMVLAYHANGANPLVKSLTGYDRAEAMDDGYHTHDGNGTVVGELSVPEIGLEIHDGVLQWNVLLRRNGYDARKAAQVYLDYCKEHGLTPMFCYDGVVDMSGERATSHPEYYKLLTDFRVYDEDGNSIRQRAVKALLPENWQVILDKYLQQESALGSKVGHIGLDEGLMKEINAVTRFASIESGERDTLTKLLTSIYGKDNVQVLATREFDAALDEVTERGHAQMLRDNGGTVYGFAVGDRIVLNEDLFNANTPMHEHTHVYMKVLKATNPRLYNRGMELWRDTPLWKQAKRGLEELGEEPTDEQIFSECMSQFTGAENEKVISEVTGITDKNWLQKAMSWLSEMWKGVKSAFSRWTQNDLDGLTAEQFGRMPLRAVYDAKERKAYAKSVKQVFGDGGAGEHGVEMMHEPSREETILRDVVIEHMKGSGLDVIGTEEGQRVLDMANEADVRLGAKQKRALETVTMADNSTNKATAISSADGAKVQNNLEKLAESYNNRSNRVKGFITDLSQALNLEQHEASHYGTFETKDGKLVTIRVSNHNARVSFFDENGEEDGISIVISNHKNKGVLNDGNAHIVEFFYPKQSLQKSENKPLADIIKCVSTVLESGKFEDTTGLAQRQEVNAQQIREHRVYHGSGAEFDHFDHSHMSEGEGSQVYGWGTYVTEVKGIAEGYAIRSKNGISMSREEWSLKRSELESNIYRAKEQLPFLKGEYKAEMEAQISEWEKQLKEYDGPNNLYTVEIPDDNGSNYLAWNEPLSVEDSGRIISGLFDLPPSDIEEMAKRDYTFKHILYDLIKINDKAQYVPVLAKGNVLSRSTMYDGGREINDFGGVYRRLQGWFGSAKAVSKFLYSLGYAGIKYPADYRSGGREDDAKNYVIFNENDAEITDHVRFFKTKNGEAYGFTVGGKIYYDPRIANAETPVHEYAHLWASALKANNAKEWKNVVDLMKGTNVWEEVKKTYPELDTDDEIADEVLATYSGRRGAERLREEMRKAAAEGDGVMGKAEAVSALQRVKRAIDKFWKAVADFLHIHYTSAEEVADRVMKDLLDGVDPRSMMDGGKSLRPETRINIVETKSEHGFKNYAEAKTWAKEHIARTYSGEETGGKGDIRISNAAVDKYLSQSAVDKSESKDVHLAVLKVLPDVIRESVDAEQHADFKKGEDGARSAANGVNPNVTIHRLYGAVRMDGKLYRVKVTLKENTRTKETPKAYSYEATKIELLEGSLSQTEGSHNLEPSNSKSEVSAGQHGNVSGLTSTFPRYSDKSITAANLLNGVEKSYDGGKFFEDYNKIREQFIGEKGASAADHADEVNTRLDNLSVAREMEAEKKDAKAIKMATGWERGADGKWRYEVGDVRFYDGLQLINRSVKTEATLNDLLEDNKDKEALFASYPSLKNMPVVLEDMGYKGAGEYNYGKGTIRLNTYLLTDDDGYFTKPAVEILNHEIQHAIQKIEGLARGGSPAMVRSEIKKQMAEVTKQIRQLRAEGKEAEAKELIKKNRGLYEASVGDDDFGSYKSLAGEVESRNVERRMGMSAEERRASLAAETEDVSREDQIFLTSGDGGNANSEMLQETGTENDYSEFAKEHGVDADMVKDYALGIKTGNLHKADFALAEIRRTMRVANRGMKLSEFGKLFRPVQKELAERYGDIEVLRQEHIDAEMRERGVMEAARKRAEEEAAKRKARADELRLLPEEELDRRYFEAVERGDDAAAREMLDEAARRKGYGDTESEYQGVGAWVAPSNPGYESDAARRADVEDNAPDVNVEDIALGYSLVDENYWHEPRKYMQTDATAVESVNAINDAMAAIRRGEKDVKVKVYRAVPTSVKEGKLRNGDWVTPSRAYAKMHGEHRLEGDYRIIEDEVPVNELWWDGNDSREWGFDDGKGYKYKNVENSRKLNDLVTRDDNGEIIAPSKRFDENVEDVRYRTSEELGQEYGSRWIDEQTNEDGRHTTQVKNTLNSYKKFGDWVMRDSGGKKVDVLDASSGLGLGTEWLRKNGIDAEDVEPYPSENRTAPTYRNYDEVGKKYDYIISNAVLNVIPNDWRASVLHNMADKLKVGGKLVINVRSAESIRKQGKEGETRITLDDPSEILVLRPNGSIKAYQKGFTKAELKEWCEKELGNGYSVEIANDKNAGGSYDTAVVVTKNNESGTIGVASEAGRPRRSAQALPSSNAKLDNNQKFANNLLVLSENLSERDMGAHEFLFNVAKAFGLNGQNLNKSFYQDLSNSVGIRISDHSANTDNITNRNVNDDVYGLVVKLSKNRFKSRSDANYLEYVYYPDKLTGERQREIVEGLNKFLQTGDYMQLPAPDRVNRSGKFDVLIDGRETSPTAKHQAANDLARQMHVEGEVEVVTSTDGLTGRQAKAKGWYDVRTGRVTIVLPNNKNAADVRETVFHEVVAHKGLRNLVGEEHFNTFLDNVYNNAEEGIKLTIDEMAEKKYNGDKRKATEEYMAHLAEDGEYVKPENQGFFAKVRDFLTDLLRKVGIKLGFKLTDNDLRYILWRSWKGLAERDGGSVFEKAEDVKMQHELGQTDEARSASGENGIMFREGSDELKDVVEKMKADVERLHEGELDDLRSGARAIGGRLSELNKAMRLQRAYDMSTVASVTELAKTMLKNGLLSEMSDYDVRRLLSVVNNVHGKGDIRPYVQKVVDMMVGNRLRNVSKAFDKLLAMRGKKVDARGVEVQGELDLAGQRMADVVWKGIGMSDDDVADMCADAQDRMMSANGAEAAAAATDYAGWQIVMHLGLLPYYNNLLAEYLASYTNTLQLIDCQYFTQCKILQISLAHNLHTPHAATRYKHGRRILRHRGAEKSVAPTDCSTSLWRKIHRIHPNRLRGSGVGCVRCM